MSFSLELVILVVLLLNSPSAFRVMFKEIEYNLKQLTIPEKFDAREKWPECSSMSEVSYRGKCDAWPFTAVAVLTDRLCVSTRGKFNNKSLSVQDLIECCKECTYRNKYGFQNKCSIGIKSMAYLHLAEEGTVSESCKSLSQHDVVTTGFELSSCRSECSNTSYDVPYAKDKKYCGQPIKSGPKAVRDTRHIQAEIMSNGPVEAYLMGRGMLASSENPDNTTIYEEDSKDETGPKTVYSVRIVGWDEKEGIPVWIFAGTDSMFWGDMGFSFIRRGKNDFQVESNVAACMTRDGRKEMNLIVASGEKASLGINCLFVFVLVQVLKF